MANSAYQDTVDSLRFLDRVAPKSILDVGAGFGRWGFLCRCHLGAGVSLTQDTNQSITIDAIEAFKGNVNPVYDAVYDRVVVGDARDAMEDVGTYDVVICSHMIEHMPKDEGLALLKKMKSKARMALVLGLPFNSPLREEVAGNPFEAHEAIWSRKDFVGEDVWLREYPFLRDETVALAIFPMNGRARWIVRNQRHPQIMRLLRWLSRPFRGAASSSSRSRT